MNYSSSQNDQARHHADLMKIREAIIKANPDDLQLNSAEIHLHEFDSCFKDHLSKSTQEGKAFINEFEFSEVISKLEDQIMNDALNLRNSDSEVLSD